MGRGARHQTAQELQFLKEAYKKGSKHERGGHTLDLINHNVVAEFGHLDPHDFKRDYLAALRHVDQGLERQKKVQSDAFVQAERLRLHALGVDTGTAEQRFANDASCAHPKAKLPQANHLSPATTNTKSHKLAKYDQLRKELAHVEQLLGHDNKPRNKSSKAKSNNKKKLKTFSAHQVRMQLRSDLEKMAAQIPHQTSHKYHIQHRFKTTLQQQQRDQIDQATAPVPVPQMFKLSDTVMSKYADAVARSPNLRKP